MLLVSIPAFMLADRWGRRTSTISGGIVLTGLMFLIGSLYATGSVKADGAAKWVVIVSVFLFGMVFCGTWAIVGKIYASEIMPGNTRAAGNSVGMAFSFVSNFPIGKGRLLTPVQVFQLARRSHHANSTRCFRIWRVFPLWSSCFDVSCHLYDLHARNPGAIPGRYSR